MRNINPFINSAIKSFVVGVSFSAGIIATTAIAVTVSTAFNTGDTLTAASLNVLKTALESLPDWLHGDTATDAVYTAGNVGIGTTAPQKMLDVSGDMYLGLELTGSQDASHIFFAPLPSSLAGPGDSAEYMRFMQSSSSGSDRFEFSDDVQILDETPELEFENTTSSTSSDDFNIYVSSYRFQIKRESTGAVLTIDASDNVGIGTTTPDATLDVAGSLRIRRQASGVQPSVCASGTEGALAITAGSRMCVCNGTGWVVTTDGSTACSF